MRAIYLALCLCITAAAGAADYPTRPIRLLIGCPPGAGMDAVARPYAQRLGEILGQPVIVENRPGAGGAVSNAAIAKSAPAGYTIGFGSNGDLVIVPLLIKVDYEPAASFTHISLVPREEGFVLLAHPSFAPNNLAELVTLAKQKPGGVPFGSGVGLPHHIAMEQFKIVAGINMLHVPYKGAGPMTQDIVGGNLLLGIGNVTAAPLIRAGKLKALAVTAKNRIPALAEVATFAEQGYPQVEASGWFGLIAPAGPPPAVVQALSDTTRKVVTEPAFNERLFNLGMRGEASTPAGLRDIQRDDAAKWSKMIRDTGVRVEQ